MSKGPAQLGHSGDEIILVVLLKTVTSYRVLKTHRPWNAYKLSTQQVTASVVSSLKRINQSLEGVLFTALHLK